MNTKSWCDKEMSGYLWWEKTVEYAFLEQFLAESNLTKITPLAGPIERDLGDAVLNDADFWGVVEFKRCKADSSSEIDKFDKEFTKRNGIKSYTDYYIHLCNLYEEDGVAGGEPHIIVYGAIAGNNIQPIAMDYWQRNDKKLENVCWHDMPMLSRDQFRDYVRVLSHFREPSANGEFRGGIMLGFDGGGNFVRAIDLGYLLDVLKREPEKSMRYKSSQEPKDPEVTLKQPWEW